MVARMSRKQVLVQLDDAQVARLDVLSDAAGDSRSGMIRRALDLYLEAVADRVAQDVQTGDLGIVELHEDLLTRHPCDHSI